MDDEKYRKIQRQNRIVQIILVIIMLLILVGVALTYFAQTPPQVKNYIGERGAKGDTEKIDYDRINNYIDVVVSGMPKPQNGKDSTVAGPQGAASTVPGPAGLNGLDSIIPGPIGTSGSSGADGKTLDVRCNPETHDYEKQYVGDEDWQVIQKNSKVCYEEGK